MGGESLPVKSLCYDYRDDILLRAYVLSEGDRQAWREFCSLSANKKVKYGKLFDLHKSIKREGQLTPIYVVSYDGKTYPADGATRLGCILSLYEFVLVKYSPLTTTRKWNDDISIRSHHFYGLSDSTLAKFMEFKRRLTGA